MGSLSRNKGASFEREVAKLIDLNLGIKVKRNLEQYQEKGLGDLNGWPGVMIECKRYAEVTPSKVRKWWIESQAQAINTGTEPVLIYKADRREHRAILDASLLVEGIQEKGHPVELSMEAFYLIARETLLNLE